MTETKTTAQEPCFWCNGARCADCDPQLDNSPAGIVYRAVLLLNAQIEQAAPAHWPLTVADALAEMLQVVSDDMRDSRAEEKEYPEYIPSARWQTVDEYGHHGWMWHAGWDEALALSRAILGLPNPNAVDAA